MAKKSCSLKFGGRDQADPSEIAEFLFLFRAVYAAAVPMRVNRSSPTKEQVNRLVKRLRKLLDSLNVGKLNNLFYQDMRANKLITQRISEESPLEIVFEGVIVAMAAAVIISGGKFKLANFLEAELPPLGTGIAKLRLALERRSKGPLGYGVRTRRVELSSDEFRELFQQDPRARFHGGFQHFLVSLQNRIDRRTRGLELSPTDIDRILRYGSDYRKGGFQLRIRKIFDRHFRFDDDYTRD